MAYLDFMMERTEHPLDALERVALRNEWVYERAGDSELAVSVAGRWCSYQVSFTWMEDMEALHLACAFDLKVPERRRTELLQLISLINEQLWLGHYDLWMGEHVVMFRHTLLLTGGAEPTSAQCAMLLRVATEACDRYFQAFQFVLWAGKPPREALDHVLFETEGEA
jgi:hypothetical protein